MTAEIIPIRNAQQERLRKLGQYFKADSDGLADLAGIYTAEDQRLCPLTPNEQIAAWDEYASKLERDLAVSRRAYDDMERALKDAKAQLATLSRRCRMLEKREVTLAEVLGSMWFALRRVFRGKTKIEFVGPQWQRS